MSSWVFAAEAESFSFLAHVLCFEIWVVFFYRTVFVKFSLSLFYLIRKLVVLEDLGSVEGFDFSVFFSFYLSKYYIGRICLYLCSHVCVRLLNRN